MQQKRQRYVASYASFPIRGFAKNEKPPERSSSRASRVVEIGYIRQSNDTCLSQSRHLIVCSMWPRCVAGVILFSRKAAGKCEIVWLRRGVAQMRLQKDRHRLHGA